MTGSLAEIFSPVISVSNRQVCFQVDVDSMWSYLNFYGFNGGDFFKEDRLFETTIPRFIDIFDEFDVKATFFVVGRDALKKENRMLIRRLHEKGHEIANHTMNHVVGFCKLSRQQKTNEIGKCEEIIQEITGQRPVGFRAPSFSIDNDTIRILEDRGYKYDSSVFPTGFIPLFKCVIFMKSIVNNRDAPRGMGSLRHIFAPSEPYLPDRGQMWKAGRSNLVEIPISVLPIVRIPFYRSFNVVSGMQFFRLSLFWLKRSTRDINYLFHALELGDWEKREIDPRIMNHPGVRMGIQEKIEEYRATISAIKEGYSPVLMREFSDRFLS